MGTIKNLSQEGVKNALSYDPATGEFRWRQNRGTKMKAGSLAGSEDRLGYRRILVDGNMAQAHRLAWLYMTGKWPPMEIDHADGNPRNNAWNNLRLATRSQNMWNSGPHKNNSVGVKGVSWSRQRKKYVARITVNGNKIFLGRFDVFEAACAAYNEMAKKFHGDFMKSP